MAVGLQWGEHDVHQPQAEEQAGREDLWDSGSTEFPTDLRPAAVDKDGDADEGKDGEECDGEGQRSRVDPELLALRVVIDGSDGPGHTNTEEDVHSVTPSHVADGGVSVLVLDGGHLTGKGVWKWEEKLCF